MRRGSCKSYSITFCSPGRGYTHVYKQRIKSVHSVGMAFVCRMFGLHLQHGGLDRGCEIGPCEIGTYACIYTYGTEMCLFAFFFYQTVSGILTIERISGVGAWSFCSSFPPVHQPLQSENHTPPPINNSSSQTSSSSPSPFLSFFFIIDFLPKNSNLTSPGKIPPSTKSCRIQVQRQ